MKAFVFPGQGSQYCGMGKDIYDAYPEAAKLMESANEILGYAITDIMFNGDEEVLRQTRYTQPAIFLHSMTITSLLGEQDIAMSAGHSLGEYSALCFAGALDFQDALTVVSRRGEIMQEAAETTPGAMAAIIGMDDEALDGLLTEASVSGIVQAANFNSPGQVVISGEIDAVKAAVELAPSKGARMAKQLPVSGAFHSPLMAPAVSELEKALDAVTIRTARIPVCMNVTAAPVTDAGDIRQNLLSQLQGSVRWTQSVQAMIAAGVSEFTEIGPQKVLQGLIKRIDRSAAIAGIDTAEQLASARNT